MIFIVTKIVSIPHGTIKSGFLGRRRRYRFQFHMVRLKVFSSLLPMTKNMFQFHMVRLKESPNGDNTRDGYCFNSTWYD